MADAAGGMSKKAAKKAARKAAKKDAKKASGGSTDNDQAQTQVPTGYETDLQYGIYPLMQSERTTERTFTEVGDLDKSKVGSQVWVRARVSTSRSKGNGCFLVLRRRMQTVQGVIFKSDTVPKPMVKFAAGIAKESFVDVYASVVEPESPTTTTQSVVELAIEKIFLLSAAEALPIEVEACNMVEPTKEEEEAEEKAATADDANTGERVPKVALTKRLDHRYLDLRAPVNQSIFRIQSGVCLLFREYLAAQGFTEVHTPKLLGAGSESGAEMFKVDYFDRHAYLALSPQLFKQMAVVSDLERVFEVAPVFRAEYSFTHRHLCEFMGLDMEMVIQEHYHEALGVINEMFKYIFNGLEDRYANELATIRKVYPSEPVKFDDQLLVVSFPEAIRMLREAGETSVQDLEDIGTVHEKMLGRLIKQKYGSDFYVIDKYPVNARPFYTMPHAEDDNYTNSYDIFVRGQEVSSGAQRVHDPKTLLEVAKRKEMDLSEVHAYVDSFRYGALPHAGCGIGLERVVFLYLGLHDIRKASMFPRDPKRISP